MNRYLKGSLIIISGVVISFIIVLTLLYIFIQTPAFNQWALEMTLNKLNDSWEMKHNKIRAESLEGNILQGLKLNKGTITVKEDTLLNFESLDLKYDIWGLLNHEIKLDYVILTNPKIYLTRFKGSNDSLMWNFANLFSSAVEKDTTPGVFDWEVTIEKLKVDNGYLNVTGAKDSVQRKRLSEFDFNYLNVNNFYLELKAEYFKNFKNLSLKNLSFNTNSDFNIHKLKFDANINIKDTITDLWNMELVTDKTDAKINKLRMTSLNPLKDIIYEEFKDKELNADIDIDKFNFADLKFFVPSLNVLDSAAGLKLQATGKYGDLNVSSLSLALPNSIINLKGKIINLQDPSKLYFDVVSENSKINPGDLHLLYREPSLSNYGYLGSINTDFTFKGTFNNFRSDYRINTQSGLAEGAIDLNLDYKTYKGNLNTSNLNLGRLLQKNNLNSNLNMSAYFSGSGFSLSNMSTELNYNIYNSNFAGFDVTKSRGIIKAVSNNINLNINHISSMGNVLVAGNVNISNLINPIYSLKGKVSKLDISRLTKKPGDKSNLNLSFVVNGRGSNINNINGHYNFNIGNSSYANYKIPATPLNVIIQNSGRQSKLSAETNMFDFKADGSFDLSSLTKILQNNIASITNAVNNKLQYDSLNLNQGGSITRKISYGNINLKYSLTTKDTSKLEEVLRPFGVRFNGNITGDISNDGNEFLSNLILKIDDFVYNDTGIVLKNVYSNLSLKNRYTIVSTENSLEPYLLNLGIKGDKIIYNNNKFDSVYLSANMLNSQMKINGHGGRDSTLFALLNGNIDMTGAGLKANIDTMRVKYNLNELKNTEPWVIDYNPSGDIDFEKFAVQSKDIAVSINGKYSINGNSDIKIESRNINPYEVLQIINQMDSTNETPAGINPIKGGIDLYINYKGNKADPHLNVKLNSDNLKYNDSAIGKINVNIQYDSSVAKADINLLNNNDKGNLKITGEIPYSNPLMPEDSATNKDDLSNSPLKLDFTAKNFEIGSFTKLIPSLPDLSGVMEGNISAGGIVSAPELKGKLDINHGNIFAALTGMDYGYKLSFSTENSKLNLNKLSIYNVGNESRHFDVFGDIDFKDLKLNDISLSTSGDFYLLDGTAIENTLGVEGSILGGVGNNPVTIKGNLQKLDITGQFLIKDATISSLPTKGSGYNAEDDNFIYVNETKDTIRIDSVIAINEDDLKKINPFERGKYKVIGNSNPTGIINLDLNIKTQKKIYVSIDFNNITRDRLYGEINADLNLKTVDNQLNAVGDIDVLKDSYYRFYKVFKLDDSKISFNGPISEPSLDIRAVHEGTKVTQQYGSNSNLPVKVALTLKGQIKKPDLAVKLYENGSEITGNDAESDAISYLLFGRYKSELSTSQRTSMASSLGTSFGSLYITSFISETVREILPFITDAEFNYSEGKPTDTDVQLTSAFGDATVKVGGKLLTQTKNFEFSIDYPLNKLFNLNLPETLILQISREEISNGSVDNSQSFYNTGLKIAYKFKY